MNRTKHEQTIQTNITDMTVKQLQLYIRKQTEKANIVISRSKGNNSKAMQKELQILERKGIVGKSGKAVLNFKGKNKSQLKAQARELEYFNQWKGTETKPVRDKTSYKKYKSFIKNNKDFANYTYEEWRDLVTIVGTMEDKVNSFGYENFKELHREATESNTNVDMVTAMSEAIKELEASGQTPSQELATDILRKHIFK